MKCLLNQSVETNGFCHKLEGGKEKERLITFIFSLVTTKKFVAKENVWCFST